MLLANNVNVAERVGIVTQYTYTGYESILPIFTPEDYKYIISDTANSDGSTTRTIYSINSVYPTKCKLNSTYITSIDYYRLSETETIDLSDAFNGCYNVVTINLSMLNTSNCASFSQMFKDCKKVVTLDLSNFDMAKAQIINGMFNNCLKLQMVNTTGWGELNSVTKAHYMFINCNSLTEIIGLNSWVLKSVTNTNSMFYGCNSLYTLDLSNLNLSNNGNMSNMFYNCNKLTQLKLDNFVIKSSCNTSNMLAGVLESCIITVPSNFGKTESDCGFTGTFTVTGTLNLLL